MILANFLATRRAQGFAETYPYESKVVSDMTALHHLHEAGILHNLGQRAQLKDQRPYTFMVSLYRHAQSVSCERPQGWDMEAYYQHAHVVNRLWNNITVRSSMFNV